MDERNNKKLEERNNGDNTITAGKNSLQEHMDHVDWYTLWNDCYSLCRKAVMVASNRVICSINKHYRRADRELPEISSAEKYTDRNRRNKK